MIDTDRTDALSHALRALPLARAPRTLLPRVMAAVAARLAPRRPTWFDWPAWAQVASAVVMLLLVAGASLLRPDLTAWAASLLETDAVRLLERVLRVWQPLVLTVMAIVTALVLTCATFGALLGRVALGGVSR